MPTQFVTRVDRLGVAISDAGYLWTPAMRHAYEQAVASAHAAVVQYGECAVLRDLLHAADEILATIVGEDDDECFHLAGLRTAIANALDASRAGTLL